MSSVGTDAKISGAKLEPLASNEKYGVPHSESSGGVVGSDYNIEEARLDPLGGKGVGQHPHPHADDQGSVGIDENIDKAKIGPLVSTMHSGSTKQATGLPDEQVDAARVEPMGEVRDE